MRRPSRDLAAAAGGLDISFALGLVPVALPLAAIKAGCSPAQIGVLTAASAVTQMSSRLALGRVMQVVPDWGLIAAAARH